MVKLFTLLVLSSNVLLFSQHSNLNNSVMTENGQNVFFSPVNQTFNFSPPIDTARKVPGLRSWSDYWTNGNNQRKVVVFGDTVVVCNEILDSATAQTLTARKLYYQVSYDGGATWLSDAVLWHTNSIAYPDMWPIFQSGSRTVLVSGRQYLPAGGSRGFGSYDVILGAGTVTSTLLTLGGDYFSWPISATHVAGIHQIGDSLLFRKFNYTNAQFDPFQIIALPPADIGAGARKMVAASDNGQNIFVMWNNTTVGSEKYCGRRSSDGGSTFGAVQTIMQDGFTLGGNVMNTWVTMDLIYKPGTINPCTAFNAVPADNSVKSYKILFWAPGINGGIPVRVADYTNTPYLADTAWAFYSAALLQVNNTYLSHPTLAYSSDGSRLVCVFTVAQKDSITYSTGATFLFNDLFTSYSSNDGATWSAPVRITNTAQQDEIYPIMPKTGNTPGNFGLIFQTSSFPGSSSFSQTTTAVISPNWTIYTRFDPVTGNQLPIGIKTISSEVPESFSLGQNYPNPFNPVTKLRFNIVSRTNVSIKVFDVTGRLVSVIVNNETVNPGVHEVQFNAQNLSSGVYYYTMETPEFRDTKKMVLVK